MKIILLFVTNFMKLNHLFHLEKLELAMEINTTLPMETLKLLHPIAMKSEA